MLGQGVPAFANFCHPECSRRGETFLKVTEVWLSHLSEGVLGGHSTPLNAQVTGFLGGTE